MSDEELSLLKVAVLLATVVLEVDSAGAETDVVPVDVLDAGAVLVCGGGGGTGLVVFVDGADGVDVGVVLDVDVGLVDAVELGVLGGGADVVVALVVVEDVLVEDVEELVDEVELVDDVDELVDDVEVDVGAVLVVAAGVEGAAGAVVVVVTGAVELVGLVLVVDLRLSVPAPPLNTTGIDDWCETD